MHQVWTLPCLFRLLKKVWEILIQLFECSCQLNLFWVAQFRLCLCSHFRECMRSDHRGLVTAHIFAVLLLLSLNSTFNLFALIILEQQRFIWLWITLNLRLIFVKLDLVNWKYYYVRILAIFCWTGIAVQFWNFSFGYFPLRGNWRLRHQEVGSVSVKDRSWLFVWDRPAQSSVAFTLCH